MGYSVWLASYPKSGNTWMRVFLRNLTHTSAPADINSVAEHFPYDVAAKYYQAVASHPKVTLVKTRSALVIGGWISADRPHHHRRGE